jgi:hypothetical protein
MSTKILLAIVISVILAVFSNPLSSLLSTNTIISDAAGQEEKVNTTSSGMELSTRPVWDEVIVVTDVTRTNETQLIVNFIGNGTMTVPDTGQIINMTNSGHAIMTAVPGNPDIFSTSGREEVYSEDGDTTAFTYHEIIQNSSATPNGTGIIIAVFDRNATGSLAPFNGMIVVGTHDEPLNNKRAIMKLWEWQSGAS